MTTTQRIGREENRENYEVYADLTEIFVEVAEKVSQADHQLRIVS